LTWFKHTYTSNQQILYHWYVEFYVSVKITFDFLLAYNSCTGGYIMISTYAHTIYLRFTFLFLLPPFFLESFQQVSFFYFHIGIQNTTTIFTLIPLFHIPIPLPLVPIPRKDLKITFLKLLYFFSYVKDFILFKFLSSYKNCTEITLWYFQSFTTYLS
jgi:hypothetical protein